MDWLHELSVLFLRRTLQITKWSFIRKEKLANETKLMGYIHKSVCDQWIAGFFREKIVWKKLRSSIVYANTTLSPLFGGWGGRDGGYKISRLSPVWSQFRKAQPWLPWVITLSTLSAQSKTFDLEHPNSLISILKVSFNLQTTQNDWSNTEFDQGRIFWGI